MNQENQKADVRYDFETDSFFAKPIERDYNTSFQNENFIFDLDSNNKVVGIEILDASKAFGIPKIYMKNQKKLKIDILVSKEIIKVKIVITTLIRNSEKVSNLEIERINQNFLKPSEMNLAMI